METPDEVLVNEVREGNRESFTVLVDRYRDRMVRAAYHLVNDADAAQDLAQDAFVDGYRNLHGLNDPAKFRAWLCGILHHKCSRHLSRLAHAPVPLGLTEPAPAPADQDPLTELTLNALNQMPSDCRSLLAARYLQGLSYEEIAQALDTTVNNVRVRCCRAKAQLRALIAEVETATAETKEGLT